jgi:hypothetical protein
MNRSVQFNKVQWEMLEELARRSRPRLKPDDLLKNLVMEAYGKKR